MSLVEYKSNEDKSLPISGAYLFNPLNVNPELGGRKRILGTFNGKLLQMISLE